ncbi:unnamed protein product, partial [Didymodactylos carnosus]
TTPTSEIVARGMAGLKKILKSGIQLVARDRHAEQAIRTRVGSGRLKADEIIEAYRTGREFSDSDGKTYIRHKSATGTTVVTDRRNGKIVTVQSDDKPNSRWKQIANRGQN